MTKLSWAEISRFVHERGQYRCEYCQTPQRITGQAMHIEHIIPDEGDDLENLALACPSCNLSKAKAISAIDPITKQIQPLFNPRKQIWDEHFEWNKDATLVLGKTAIGRASIIRLKMNQLRIVEARIIWIFAGIHPP